MSYLNMSIVELHNVLIKGQITPLDLINEVLKAAKEDTNNAFEYICEKEALAQVENLKNIDKNNLLWGIPFVLKDNFSTKDIPTTGSSNILNGYLPIFSSEVYERLTKEGAILIGKTTLDELAMGGTGTSGHLGRTFNPYDPSHTRLVGGSSSGSAALCANGLAPFAIGSDTGDSVRKPASHAGLVGLKPTWGRISRYGVFPFAPSLDHVAYFTRNVEDSAILLNVLAGRDNKDATSSFVPTMDYTKFISGDIKGKKIAIINEIYKTIKNPTIIKAFEKTLEGLKKKGAIINYVSFSEDLCKALYPTYIIISCAEATSNNANLDGIKFGARKNGEDFESIMINTRSEGFGELIKRRFIIGSYALMKENQEEIFIRAQKCRRLIVDAINNILKDNDCIYLPAAPSTAPYFDQQSDVLSDDYMVADNHLCIANFAGLPSITLPIGYEDNFPFGANITCRRFEENELFNLASALEDVTGLKNISAKGGK